MRGLKAGGWEVLNAKLSLVDTTAANYGCSAVDTLRGGGAISHASLAGNLHLMLKICEAFAFDAREVRCAVHSWTLTSGGPAILHETCFGGGCLHVHGTHMYAAFNTQTTLH